MADPYIPPHFGTQTPGTASPGTDRYRADSRPDMASTAPASRSGLSTGVIVAIVFVVVAIIAAVMFSNRGTSTQGTGSTAPAVIDNTVRPADTNVQPGAQTSAPAAPPASTAPAPQAPSASTTPAPTNP